MHYAVCTLNNIQSIYIPNNIIYIIIIFNTFFKDIMNKNPYCYFSLSEPIKKSFSSTFIYHCLLI